MSRTVFHAVSSQVRLFVWFGVLACGVATFAEDRIGRDTLFFRNGDSLFGQLESIHPTNGIRWRHAEAQAPIQFRLGNITQIEFPSRGLPISTSSNDCQLRLENGDSLKGHLRSCDSQWVTLDTWYAGEMKLSRKYVRSLVFLAAPATATFSGPTGIEGWTHGKSFAAGQGDSGEWIYKEGAFYASKAASIARDLHLPDVARIEFDLSWKEMLRVAVALYADSLQPVALSAKESEPDFGGFYSFQLNSYFAGQPPVVDLLAIKKAEPLRYMMQMVNVPVLTNGTRAHIELLVSKPKRSIVIRVNDTLVKEAVDSAFVGNGTCMRFVHQGLGKVKLSNIRVSPWNGFLEQPVKPGQTNVDLVHLDGGATQTGKVELISSQKLVLITGEKRTELPSGSVRQVEFAVVSPAETESPGPVEVKACFSNGGTIRFAIEQWDQQGIKGRSPMFGTAKFDPAAFSRVQFEPKP